MMTMHRNLGRNEAAAVMAYLKVLSRHTARTKENHKNLIIIGLSRPKVTTS
jgi:hypothetical protein